MLFCQGVFRFADFGDDGLGRGGPDEGPGVFVPCIDVSGDGIDQPLTLVAERRFSCLVVSSLKKHSTRFSHKADVEVKWN